VILCRERVFQKRSLDYDLAAQSTLSTWRDETPAFAISTKDNLFLLNRLPGASLLPVESGRAGQSFENFR